MKKLFTPILTIFCLFSFIHSFAQKEDPANGITTSGPDPKFGISDYKLNIVSNGGPGSNGALFRTTSSWSTVDIDAPAGMDAGVRLGNAGLAKWAMWFRSGSNNFNISEFDVGERFTIAKTSGNVGVGVTSPNAYLHVRAGNWDVTNGEGDLKVGDDTYRLKIGVATAGGGAGDARIYATGGTNRIIFGNGITDRAALFGANFGIGLIDPSAKFHISHTTQGLNTNPHIKLTTTDDNFHGRIRMENSDGLKYFIQKFDLSGSVTSDYNINWEYNGTDIFNVSGNGNATHNGFTKLGSSAPSIKVLRFNGTTSASQGLLTSIAHGLTSSKIISVTVLVEYGPGLFVPHSYIRNINGYQFDFYIDLTNINIVNHPTNSANILSKPYKIMVTYEE